MYIGFVTHGEKVRVQRKFEPLSSVVSRVHFSPGVHTIALIYPRISVSKAFFETWRCVYVHTEIEFFRKRIVYDFKLN